jgi:chromosome segregation ATPase
MIQKQYKGPAMDEFEAAPEPGAAEQLTLAVSDTLQVDVETVRDAEQQSRKRPASLTNEQQTGKLDDKYMAETKNWKTLYETSIHELQKSIAEINSRISIAEKAVNHLKNLQPYLDINENYFLGLVHDPAASIETNRVELRKYIDKLETRRNKLEDSLKEEKRRLDNEKENTKRQKVESSDIWIKYLKEKVVEIPEDVNQLRAFLQQELSVKIPCSQRLSSFISTNDGQRLCDEVASYLNPLKAKVLLTLLIWYTEL